jgi:uncharacterized membrane protein
MDASGDSRDKITPEPASKVSADILVWAIIAVQLIVAVYGFMVLPAIVPIHWGANGQVNGYGPKWIGTFLFPLMSLGIYLLVRVLIAAGPRLGGREVTATNLQVAKIVIAGVTLFMLIIQLVMLAAGLGIAFDMTMVISLAVSVLFIFIGNFMGRMRRNFWMGIRTPWTLTNATVWEMTHRLGGWLFVAVGLVGIVCSFVPAIRLWGVVVSIIVVTVFLVIYSYVCYQQQTREDHEPLSPPFGEES